MRLRARITLALCTFSLVPLAVAIVVGYRFSAEARMLAAKGRLETLTALKAVLLDVRLAEHAQLAFRFQREFGTLDLHGDLRFTGAEERRPIERWVDGVSPRLPLDAELLVLGLDGAVLAASRPDRVGRVLGDAHGVARGRIATQTTGPVRLTGIQEVMRSAVLLPLRDRSGVSVAELVVLGTGSSLIDWLALRMPEGAVAEIRGLDGRTLLRWPPEPGRSEPPEEDPAASRIHGPVQALPGGASLRISVPRRRVLGQLFILGKIGLVALVLVGLAAVLFAVLLGRALSRPLLALAQQAQKIGSGHLEIEPPPPEVARSLTGGAPGRGDEIAILWRAMDGMRSDLERSRSRLDELLDQRTRALAEHEGLIASLFEVLPEVVIVFRDDHRVVATNRRADLLLGPPAGLPAKGPGLGGEDPPRGTTCHQMLYGLGEPCPSCPLTEVLGGARRRRIDPVRPNRSGEALVLDLVAVGPRAGATLAMYTGRVMTSERVLQMRLMHQEKMAALGTMAAGLAHELGNPLASMSAIVQLETRRRAEGQASAPLASLGEELERMRRSLREFTGAARSRGGRAHLVLLGDLAERAVRLVRYDPRARGVDLRTETDPEVGPVDIDEDAWLQALLNLLVNALDAVAEVQERAITVRTWRDAEAVVIEVADSGAGMSPEVCARAGELLFTTKPPGAGTGLGLFMVQETVRASKGVMEISSAMGRGTTVRLRLPERKRGRPSVDRPRGGVGREKILAQKAGAFQATGGRNPGGEA